MEMEKEREILEIYCRESITREQLIIRYGREAERVISVVKTRFCKKCGKIFKIPHAKTAKICWDCRLRFKDDYKLSSAHKLVVAKNNWYG